jgi:hypothetical protein
MEFNHMPKTHKRNDPEARERRTARYKDRRGGWIMGRGRSRDFNNPNVVKKLTGRHFQMTTKEWAAAKKRGIIPVD